MRLFITGGGGLLGSRLAEVAVEDGHETFSGYCHNPSPICKNVSIDLEDHDSIANALMALRPEVIYHTAALTDVDRCEREPGLAHRINVLGTECIANIAREIGAFLVYISTDYVFDGNKGSYQEHDPTNPISKYGLTKLQGERYGDCIARTCVVYGARPASGKVNFALWVLEKLQQGENIRVVTDQYITPTLNTNLARMLLDIGDRRLKGTYHLAGATRVSRYDFACSLADAFDLDKSLIAASSMEDMSWAARRPMDSSLDTSKAGAYLLDMPYNLYKSINILKEERASASGHSYKAVKATIR